MSGEKPAPPLTTNHSQITTMLKYIKNYAATIKDIDIYPIFSLMVFVLFFIGVLYFVKKMDKKRVSEMSHLPLDLQPENGADLSNLKQA